MLKSIAAALSSTTSSRRRSVRRGRSRTRGAAPGRRYAIAHRGQTTLPRRRQAHAAATTRRAATRTGQAPPRPANHRDNGVVPPAAGQYGRRAGGEPSRCCLRGGRGTRFSSRPASPFPRSRTSGRLASFRSSVAPRHLVGAATTSGSTVADARSAPVEATSVRPSTPADARRRWPPGHRPWGSSLLLSPARLRRTAASPACRAAGRAPGRLRVVAEQDIGVFQFLGRADLAGQVDERRQRLRRLLVGHRHDALVDDAERDDGPRRRLRPRSSPRIFVLDTCRAPGRALRSRVALSTG